LATAQVTLRLAQLAISLSRPSPELHSRSLSNKMFWHLKCTNDIIFHQKGDK
jgi:hypothetical protein